MKHKPVYLLLLLSICHNLVDAYLSFKGYSFYKLASTSVGLGVCGYVITVILMEQEMILSFWPNFLYRIKDFLDDKYCTKSYGQKFYIFIMKPLGICETCFTGQIAFWYYILHTPKYNPYEHISMICFSIFTIKLIMTQNDK